MGKTIEQIDRVAIDLRLIKYTGTLCLSFLAYFFSCGSLCVKVRRSLPKETIVDLVLIGLPISIIFARIYYVIFNWEYYAEHPIKIMAIREGGLAIHGVLIGAVLTIIVFAKYVKFPFGNLPTFCTQPNFSPGNRTGKFYKSGSPRGTSVPRISRKSLFTRFYH